jgi:cell division septal protein FtsQ
MKQLLLKLWWLWVTIGGSAALALLPPLPPFRLAEIAIVSPRVRLTEVDLVRQTGVQKGQNLLTLSRRKIHANLLQSPWVEEATVSLSLPGRLILSVKEQKPVALLKTDALYLVNGKGVAFKRVGAGDPKNFPLMTGLKSGDRSEIQPLLKLITDFQGHEVLQKVGLSEVHWDPKEGVSLFTLRPVVRAALGKDEWSRRMERFSRLVPELKGKRGEVLTVDLTYEKRIFVKRRG